MQLLTKEACNRKRKLLCATIVKKKTEKKTSKM